VADAASLGELLRLGEQRPQPLLVAEQHVVDVREPLARNIRALDHHLRRIVAAHGIKGDCKAGGHCGRVGRKRRAD
jgi:hypothetical protein